MQTSRGERHKAPAQAGTPQRVLPQAEPTVKHEKYLQIPIAPLKIETEASPPQKNLRDLHQGIVRGAQNRTSHGHSESASLPRETVAEGDDLQQQGFSHQRTQRRAVSRGTLPAQAGQTGVFSHRHRASAKLELPGRQSQHDHQGRPRGDQHGKSLLAHPSVQFRQTAAEP